MSQAVLLCPSFQCQREGRHRRLPSAVPLDGALVRDGAGAQHPPRGHVSLRPSVAGFAWAEWLPVE